MKMVRMVDMDSDGKDEDLTEWRLSLGKEGVSVFQVGRGGKKRELTRLVDEVLTKMTEVTRWGQRLTWNLQLWTSPKGCPLCLCEADGLQYPVTVSTEVEGHTREGRRSDGDV